MCLPDSKEAKELKYFITIFSLRLCSNILQVLSIELLIGSRIKDLFSGLLAFNHYPKCIVILAASFHQQKSKVSLPSTPFVNKVMLQETVCGCCCCGFWSINSKNERKVGIWDCFYRKKNLLFQSHVVFERIDVICENCVET